MFVCMYVHFTAKSSPPSFLSPLGCTVFIFHTFSMTFFFFLLETNSLLCSKNCLLSCDLSLLLLLIIFHASYSIWFIAITTHHILVFTLELLSFFFPFNSCMYVYVCVCLFSLPLNKHTHTHIYTPEGGRQPRSFTNLNLDVIFSFTNGAQTIKSLHFTWRLRLFTYRRLDYPSSLLVMSGSNSPLPDLACRCWAQLTWRYRCALGTLSTGQKPTVVWSE